MQHSAIDIERILRAMKKKTIEFAKSATAELAQRLDIELDYLNSAGEKIVIAPDLIRALPATISLAANILPALWL